MALPTAYWRGVLVSRDMIAPLNEAVRVVPQTVAPIPGYGSYRNNAASGGTDNGSGHLDCYAGDGWTDKDRERFVAKAREVGLMAFYRPKTWYSAARKRWITADWGRHFHLILKDSADLSDGAKAQLKQWYGGSNGLAGFWAYGEFMYDPDPHPRTHLRQTWSQYLALKADGPGTELGNTVTPPPTTTPAPVPEEDDMPISDDDLARIRGAVRSELLGYRYPEATKDKPAGARLIDHWYNANVKAGNNGHALSRIERILSDRDGFAAQIVAGVVAQISQTTGSLTTEQLRSATEAGVRAALGSLDNQED